MPKCASCGKESNELVGGYLYFECLICHDRWLELSKANKPLLTKEDWRKWEEENLPKTYKRYSPFVLVEEKKKPKPYGPYRK